MYLGLDLGTSGLRAILVSGAGVVRAVSDQAYPIFHPQPGFSEQNPDDWVHACQRAIDDLRTRAPREFAGLRGIGLSGQMHGAVLLGRENNVLRPCILWNDTRAATQAVRLDAQPDFRTISGNIVFPGFTAPKLVWIAENEPEIFAKTAKVLLPKDYLRLWLSGDHMSDMSDASGTGWFDIRKRAWSGRLLEACGMTRAQMPKLVEGSKISGCLRSDLVHEWGVGASVGIAGGGADNAAAACGAGCLRDGHGFVSLGTSGVVLVARDVCHPAPAKAVHSFCHAVPDRWLQMGVILAATDCLNWLSRNLGQSPAALSARAGDVLTPPDGPLFLPYLSGERTPHNDSRVRGAFVGLDIADDPASLTRAVMQGVGFALRDCLEVLRATGGAPDHLLVLGGGSQSPYWTAALATILGLPLTVPRAGELEAALGAARLAIVADTGAEPTAVMTPPKAAFTIQPDPKLSDAYTVAYQRFRALYPALKALT